MQRLTYFLTPNLNSKQHTLNNKTNSFFSIKSTKIRFFFSSNLSVFFPPIRRSCYRTPSRDFRFEFVFIEQIQLNHRTWSQGFANFKHFGKCLLFWKIQCSSNKLFDGKVIIGNFFSKSLWHCRLKVVPNYKSKAARHSVKPIQIQH